MIIKLMDNNGISVRMVKLYSQSVSNKPISITFKNCIDNSIFLILMPHLLVVHLLDLKIHVWTYPEHLIESGIRAQFINCNP